MTLEVKFNLQALTEIPHFKDFYVIKGHIHLPLYNRLYVESTTLNKMHLLGDAYISYTNTLHYTNTLQNIYCTL